MHTQKCHQSQAVALQGEGSIELLKGLEFARSAARQMPAAPMEAQEPKMAAQDAFPSAAAPVPVQYEIPEGVKQDCGPVKLVLKVSGDQCEAQLQCSPPASTSPPSSLQADASAIPEGVPVVEGVRVDLSGTSVPSLPVWVNEDTTNLRMSNCAKLTALPDIGRLGALDCLELSSCPNLQSLPAEVGGLSSLKILKLD